MKALLEKTNFTLADLLTFIEIKAQEGTYLEFKDARALFKEPKKGNNCKHEIGKDVSAFANADGGILIYGLKEDSNRQASELTFIDSKEFSKDWLQQVIESNTSRPVTDIRIDVIISDDDPAMQIYVVVIGKSARAAHMAMDGRYYRRNNEGNVMMEEYEVRDLYSRTGKTELEIVDVETINLTELPPFQGNGLRGEIMATLNFSVRNIGQALEHYYKMEVHVNAGIFLNTYPPTSPEGNKFVSQRSENGLSVFVIPGPTSLFQNDIQKMAILNIAFGTPKYQLYKEGKILIRLFYSNGIKEKEYRLIDLVKYNSEPIVKEAFEKQL